MPICRSNAEVRPLMPYYLRKAQGIMTQNGFAVHRRLGLRRVLARELAVAYLDGHEHVDHVKSLTR